MNQLSLHTAYVPVEATSRMCGPRYAKARAAVCTRSVSLGNDTLY